MKQMVSPLSVYSVCVFISKVALGRVEKIRGYQREPFPLLLWSSPGLKKKKNKNNTWVRHSRDQKTPGRCCVGRSVGRSGWVQAGRRWEESPRSSAQSCGRRNSVSTIAIPGSHHCAFCVFVFVLFSLPLEACIDPRCLRIKRIWEAGEAGEMVSLPQGLDRRAAGATMS